ncbi:MAG: fibrillarin-like rRNA/tRNA 2'-O-methyltransferase [Methanobrevibacter sp.]|jgi:fibrillarin-like pre-rRNA processing protein|nr:fibrillarin-like rRNA/tRNA 2'-O-methyltransferase [Candidatus Methanovirga aequatorialis]
MEIYIKEGQIATKNLSPGLKVYGEELITENMVINDEEVEVEYRLWNPYRSKLAGALLNGMSKLNIKNDYKVLYLGASTGTTVSHISDIVYNGLIYAVEFSPVTMRKLTRLADNRPNIAPILSNANKPKNYLNLVEKVDFLYCDVAQPNQSELFMDNVNLFLKEEAKGLITIKARSIDVSKNPKKVFKEEEKKLVSEGFRILERIKLEPYEKDHLGLLVEKGLY